MFGKGGEKMKKGIHDPVIKTDHKMKVQGKAKYVADYKLSNMLYVYTFRSRKSRAKVSSIRLPKIPEGYYVIDHQDIPGENILKVVFDDQPILAKDKVNYIGEPILLVAGPDRNEIFRILSEIDVEYEELDAIYTMKESEKKDVAPIYGADNCFEQFDFNRGNMNAVFSEAAEIIEDTFQTGYQEQLYIEPQGMIGIIDQGKITIKGSMQCPYYVKDALIQAFGCEEDQVRVVQTTTGGAFGGKEDYPSLLACHAALAAYKSKRPVQLLLDREEDITVTTKRHPSWIHYKTALDKEGNILGIEVEVKLNGGAYSGLSNVVLQRSLLGVLGVYNIPVLHVKGKALATNTVPTGAFRGFGAPQSFFAIEMHMDHIAKHIGINPLALKMKYMVKQNDPTCTGGLFRHRVPLPEMIQEAEKMSAYQKKYDHYGKQKEDGSSTIKRGIGLSLFLHGCGFTGSGERDFIRSTVKLLKHEDDQVEILVANVDMGQGLQTTLNKIVADTLSIPLGQVIYRNPDTDRVPNSGPTVASRSLMIVGKLLERAAVRLKKDWIDGKKQEIIEHYKHPDMIPWDERNFYGDAYPTYSWGLNVVETEVDTITGQVGITGIWSVFDVGKAIDDRIMQGQIEGGIVQGLGYASSEVMVSEQGKIMQHTVTDYIIPTAKDVVKIENKLIDNLYEEGPYGAKGAGELTLIGAAPAFAAAVENALGRKINRIPITPEYVMEVLGQ